MNESKRETLHSFLDARYFYRFYRKAGMSIFAFFSIASVLIGCLSIIPFILILNGDSFRPAGGFAELIACAALFVAVFGAFSTALGPIFTFILVRLQTKEIKRNDMRRKDDQKHLFEIDRQNKIEREKNEVIRIYDMIQESIDRVQIEIQSTIDPSIINSYHGAYAFDQARFYLRESLDNISELMQRESSLELLNAVGPVITTFRQCVGLFEFQYRCSEKFENESIEYFRDLVDVSPYIPILFLAQDILEILNGIQIPDINNHGYKSLQNIYSDSKTYISIQEKLHPLDSTQ